jgi:hypothetical protein
MRDLYGSDTPYTLHTRTPMCLPTPLPPLTTAAVYETAYNLLPLLLVLVALPWLLSCRRSPASKKQFQYQVPPPPPPTPRLTPQHNYVIYGWGGEETPLIWNTPITIHYPQVVFSSSAPKSPDESPAPPEKED